MGIAASALGGPLAIAGLAGSAISAVGTLFSGSSTAAADAYQAQVAANNAKIATQQSKFDIQAGEIQAVNQGLKTKATVGQQKAAQGASGIDVNSGSAVDVRAGTASRGVLDTLTIRSNAAKKAYSDEVTATSDTAQGQLDTFAGETATTGSEIGAAGTLLSGASTVGANYAKLQNSVGSGAAGTGFVSGL
jgi:hypothetical protein